MLEANTAAPLRLTPEGIMPQATKPTTTTDRFELEQQMIDTWQIIDDIKLLHQMNAHANDIVKLATVYDYKFKRMWATFESLVKARQL
jgi:hypothetical protein